MERLGELCSDGLQVWKGGLAFPDAAETLPPPIPHLFQWAALQI